MRFANPLHANLAAILARESAAARASVSPEQPTTPPTELVEHHASDEPPRSTR